MAKAIRIGLVGMGKIARDQHLPALERPGFALVAAADPHVSLDGTPSYGALQAMLEAHPDIEAVSICTPPAARCGLARAAIDAGKHVLLEKPPGATLGEVETLRRLGEAAGVTLFAAWHSRFAPAVEPARCWLADRAIKGVRIDWREDVRRWHPGQAWIWEPGGLGVFDAGINALSIATAILPQPFGLKAAALHVPANRQAPMAADLTFEDLNGAPILAGFDWGQTGPQTWDIQVQTDRGALHLSRGGGALSIDGQVVSLPAEAEYPRLYDRFAELVRQGRSEVDVVPLRHVADAFLLGRRIEIEPFIE